MEAIEKIFDWCFENVGKVIAISIVFVLMLSVLITLALPSIFHATLSGFDTVVSHIKNVK